MKKIVLLIACFGALSAAAQNVGIGNNNPKATLQISSDTSGIIIPKYVTLAIVNINVLPKLNATDHKGLQVYVDEISNRGLWFYNGTSFEKVGGSNPFFKISASNNTNIIFTNNTNYGKNFIVNADSINWHNNPESKMMLINSNGKEGAFRVGNIDSKSWDIDSIGLSSFAAGAQTKATGDYSTAMGYYTNALGFYSTALGYGSSATGNISIASGIYSTAAGSVSTAMGFNSMALGNTSTTMGNSTTAKSYGEVAIGNNNTDYVTANNGATIFNAADRAFTVGIGVNYTTKKDGFIVYKDGTLKLDSLATAPLNATNRLYIFKNKLHYNGVAVGDSSQLQKVTENGATGYRILGRDTANYGNIGANALDLSYSISPSTTNGATGEKSIALGNSTTASGLNSIAIGNGSIASGIQSMALGVSTKATGINATALSIFTTASGANSFAAGSNTSASGYTSTALGDSTTAAGAAATTMGSFTTASGNFSVAAGFKTSAKSFGEVAVGAFNTDYTITATGAGSNNIGDRAFVVGIGTGNVGRKDGLIVYKNGTLGLNNLSTVPSNSFERLYVLNSELFFNGNEIVSQLQKITEGTGPGYRLLSSNPNFYGNIGQGAIDLSTQTQNSGIAGATGINSFATGLSNTAFGFISTVMGAYNNASGSYSTATGFNTTSKSFGEISVGTYNTNYTVSGNGILNFNPADRAFVVGIGADSTNKKDGLIVYKDGTVTLNVLSTTPDSTTNRLYNIGNTLYINGTVVGTQTSDIRYKEKIENLSTALSNIKKLRPVSFYWKNNKWGSQKEIGFIAQEIKELYPEVVSTDADGYYKVNYGLLTSVLTKGMQEQQTQIETLQKQIETVQKQNQFLATEIEAIKTALNKTK